MWTAFVFFGFPSKIYFIEGDDQNSCSTFLKNNFGLEGKIDSGKSEVFNETSLDKLLKLFNVTEEIFQQIQTDPLYFHYSKNEQLPKKIRAVDGEFCKICKNFYPMATVNQPDNSMVCWSCRDTKSWMFQ